MYTKTTNSIKVTVIPAYLEQHSEPEENRYVWAYTVQLENHSKEPVQLLTLALSHSVTEAEAQRGVQAWLLPLKHPDPAQQKEFEQRFEILRWSHWLND